MSHFSDEYWFDYVRRLLPPEQMNLMKDHLEESCKQCRDSHDVWRKIVKTASRATRYEPDPADVRVVAAAFEAQKITIRWNRISARLIFDSFRDVAPAGFRSASIPARQLLCEAKDWTVALRQQAEWGKQISLAGHLTKSGVLGEEVAGLEVTILHGEMPVAQTATNEVGEFYLRYQDANGLQLRVRVSDQDALEIELPDGGPWIQENSL